MNMQHDLDTGMYYENIEKSWKKYKFYFIGLIIVIFAVAAIFTAYHNSVKEKSAHDTSILFEMLSKKEEYKQDYKNKLVGAIAQVKGKNIKDMLTLELAKEYAKENDIIEFEKNILPVLSSRVSSVKNVANYMYAEFLLENEQAKAQDVFKYVEIKKTDFAYPMVQEVQAMALAQAGKKDEADVIYNQLLQNVSLDQDFKQRIKIKLEQ